MKRVAALSCAAVGIVAVSAISAAAAPAASASGSGSAYQDFQTGVTYTVYQPTFTAGISSVKVTGMSDAGTTDEENLSASYGKKNSKNFRIQEGNPMTTDIGQGALVAKVKVQGRTAKVYAYCDPASSKKCTMADIAKVGGHLDVTLPAAKGLHQTRVWIETLRTRAISGAQLISIAKGLKQLPQ